MQGHSRASGMQADSGETVASYAGHGGFVFTMEDPTEIKGMLLANEVPAASGAKAIVSCEVTLPSQNPKTSFFQASDLTTDLSRGTFETPMVC